MNLKEIPIIDKKNDLYLYLIEKQNIKNGIEIGVREGFFAKEILSKTTIEYYGLDININFAKHLCFKYPKYKLIHGSSPKNAELFKDEFFDWIYIDADHSYEAVKKDLIAWYPKLKNGGLFSGDDYSCVNNPSEGIYGIVEAVEEFLKNNEKDVYISGLGSVSKQKRIEFAKIEGLKIEENLRGINRHEVEIPQWLFFK